MNETYRSQTGTRSQWVQTGDREANGGGWFIERWGSPWGLGKDFVSLSYRGICKVVGRAVPMRIALCDDSVEQ